MYSFKNPVYLVIGIFFTLLGAVLMAGAAAGLGLILVLLGIMMSTFAAYQMGQSSSVQRN